MPAILIPLMPGRPDGKDVVNQASMWGSIIQAVWSFMLALRSRGLGSIWATVTSRRANCSAVASDVTNVAIFNPKYTAIDKPRTSTDTRQGTVSSWIFPASTNSAVQRNSSAR